MILHPDGRIEGTVEECTAYKLKMHRESHSKPFKDGLWGVGRSLEAIERFKWDEYNKELVELQRN